MVRPTLWKDGNLAEGLGCRTRQIMAVDVQPRAVKGVIVPGGPVGAHKGPRLGSRSVVGRGLRHVPFPGIESKILVQEIALEFLPTLILRHDAVFRNVGVVSNIRSAQAGFS